MDGISAGAAQGILSTCKVCRDAARILPHSTTEGPRYDKVGA